MYLWCLKYFWVCGFPLERGLLLKANTAIASRRVIGLWVQLPSPHWDLVWLGLARILYVVSEVLWAHMWTDLKMFPIYHSGLYTFLFFTTSSDMNPEPGVDECSTCIPFTGEHSVVVYTVHLGLCVFSLCQSSPANRKLWDKVISG